MSTDSPLRTIGWSPVPGYKEEQREKLSIEKARKLLGLPVHENDQQESDAGLSPDKQRPQTEKEPTKGASRAATKQPSASHDAPRHQPAAPDPAPVMASATPAPKAKS